MKESESFIFGKETAFEYFGRSFLIGVFGNWNCCIFLRLFDFNGNIIASWGNKAITFPKDKIQGCSLTISLSNGENIQMSNCSIRDIRRDGIKGSPDVGAIDIIFNFPNTTSTGRAFSSNKDALDYLIEQCSKYDIRTITYDGLTFDMNEVQTAPTINAMVTKIKNMTDSSK